MVFRVAFVTVRVTGMVFVTVPIAAVMVVVPAPSDVVSPAMDPALLIIATDPFDELQATNAVRSWVLVSL